MPGDAESLAYGLGITHVLRGAACVGGGAAAGEQHSGADAVIALLLEQVGGDAGIDAAAHGDEYAVMCGHGFPFPGLRATCSVRQVLSLLL